MDPKEMKIAADEFNRDRDLWAQYRTDRLYYREQQLDKIADRQRDIIINLSLASFTVAGIALAIVSFKSNTLALWSVGIEILASIAGIILSRALLDKDDRDIRKVLEDEQRLLKKYQTAATTNYNKALDATLTKDDVINYFAIREEADKAFIIRQKKNTIINLTYSIFISLFYIGILLLLVSVLF